ncbi:acetyl/propionyl/methylcrotonyl-CoA carboxylase subunit alpha [Ferrovibrio sp.]|uniref:acetyl/propionyl/methylcrotonyl-CoA carboxylase subunit alpha n=1 Tax=Ferrovibrio sp. TaxID=1917215 RepID=UPI0025BCCBC0|nr:acetyl/propionyl/methylcrotonyl-CoA carboxylase subunit alpha [Ferrovibrio sp.]MBX3456096.1 acetyl/propionyl/methylcrotonyl-CoA carboxylase subunit alpha [Ferrovibrio sp.]
MRFDSILVANRGEIACRVIRSARALGYRTLAVYSEADAEAPHVRMADAALCIGPAEAAQSYLSIPAIIAAAKQLGAGAVHPGYGFLSENADFATACAEAGLAFIGPPPQAIAAMGNKAAAKRRMIAAGVPCVPGYQGEDQSNACLIAEAEKIGLPVMVKAASGGGGRGMRLVHKAEELPAAIATARSEALNAFGSAELILEKAVLDARHVEIQIFGDSHGNLLHFGERDCSVQRRHQKVLEEAPSPAVNAALRARMGESAVAAARAIGYIGAGTVEFLLGGDGAFYFLEMNTRLQVEHPVTEEIYGVDLVALQIRVAAGEALSLEQSDIAPKGHAIEARLYAEAPHKGFLPQSGRLDAWQPPAGSGIRVDHGLYDGQLISPYYDPMIAKIIAHGATREEARRRLIQALENTRALGIETNRGFLIDLLRHPVFANGQATTHFIPQHFAAPQTPKASPQALAIAAVLFFEAGARAQGHDPARIWSSNGVMLSPIALRLDETVVKTEIQTLGPHRYRVSLPDAAIAVTLLNTTNGALRLRLDDTECDAFHRFAGDDLLLQIGTQDLRLTDITYLPRNAEDGSGEAELRAPMNGKIVALLAKPGDAVRRGQSLVVLEAMKMQHECVARMDGVLESLSVAVNDQVATRQILAILKP